MVFYFFCHGTEAGEGTVLPTLLLQPRSFIETNQLQQQLTVSHYYYSS